jgi:hypothetical protein
VEGQDGAVVHVGDPVLGHAELGVDPPLGAEVAATAVARGGHLHHQIGRLTQVALPDAVKVVGAHEEHVGDEVLLLGDVEVDACGQHLAAVDPRPPLQRVEHPRDRARVAHVRAGAHDQLVIHNPRAGADRRRARTASGPTDA